MMFERVELAREFEQTRKSPEKFRKLWGSYYTPNVPSREQTFPFIFWDELRWRWFWSYQDEVRGLQAFQVVIDATRMAETNKSFQPAKSFADTNLPHLKQGQGSWQDLRNTFSQSAYSLNTALRRAARTETARNVVITAIALKRYELRHHQLPATLEELTPDLLKAVPIDCMDGQPLRYRRNADGTFLLYSVGENGKDDGGDPALEKSVQSSIFYWQNSHAQDWVWPQPASPEEVQKYYDERARKSK